MVVTFFGHADAPAGIYSDLLATIMDLIENQKANYFLVGDKGNFDTMVAKILKMLSKEYSEISYEITLAYFPWNEEREYRLFGEDAVIEKYSHTLFPEELATVPKRYAIEKRNRLMLQQADTVVTYVKRTHGGAAKFKELALKKGKTVIELAK